MRQVCREPSALPSSCYAIVGIFCLPLFITLTYQLSSGPPLILPFILSHQRDATVVLNVYKRALEYKGKNMLFKYSMLNEFMEFIMTSTHLKMKRTNDPGGI